MKLTKININKIPIIQQLAREIWEEHYIKIISQEQIDYMLELFYSDERIRSEIEEGISWEMLMDNENPVGYLVCEIAEEKLFISKIYLKAETRGKGFGKLLLNRAIEIAKQNQKTSIYLNVNKENKGSIGFYEANGFHKIDEGVFDIGNGYVMDDFIFELNL